MWIYYNKVQKYRSDDRIFYYFLVEKKIADKVFIEKEFASEFEDWDLVEENGFVNLIKNQKGFFNIKGCDKPGGSKKPEEYLALLNGYEGNTATQKTREAVLQDLLK